ncbi:MAG TPA: hypothetical protein VIA62_16925 [Thermoanaerobaculia bacterium]|nr:hypothetical protein [Thermoanaerobaculia bacterium]
MGTTWSAHFAQGLVPTILTREILVRIGPDLAGRYPPKQHVGQVGQRGHPQIWQI